MKLAKTANSYYFAKEHMVCFSIIKL